MLGSAPFAPQHWRNEWTDRAELEGDMATIRSLDIPCTAFWIDTVVTG